MAEYVEEHECATFLEYAGAAGATQSCANAVERLLLTGSPPTSALILTQEADVTRHHALLLTYADRGETIIKSGFLSGYGGYGPQGFSATLALLHWHGVELDEINVDETLLERVDASAVTKKDLAALHQAKPLRPRRLWDYILDQDDQPPGRWNPWLRREPIIPLPMMDPRLADGARDFWSDPDGTLLKAHRSLEEAVRLKAEISLAESGGGPARMYALAFNGNSPRLSWPETTASEHAGRAGIFLGVLTAYRHPRAHRSDRSGAADQLAELMLLNHLYTLEASAVGPPDHQGLSRSGTNVAPMVVKPC